MLIRRFFAFVISAFLIFFPAYSYATTSVGGWTALDTITAGATNTINAVKGAGATGMRSAVAVAPSAVKVGKHLIKGGGAAALLLAVPQLLGDGVDWVLDPANNRIKYTVDGVNDPNTQGYGQYYWVMGASIKKDDIRFQNATAAGNALCAHFETTFVAVEKYPNVNTAYIRCKYPNGSTTLWDVVRKPNPAYNPDYSGSPSVEKYIPIDTVAAQVISNAEAGHAPSQEAVKATALEGFAAGEHDAALDAAAVPDTGVENPPDTENPPVDPAAPFDPSSIIAAINSLKAMLAGILSSMTGFFDWVQAPVPPDDEEKKDVPFATTGDIGLDDVDRFEKRIEFSGQCPVNDFSFTMMGVTYAKPIPYYHLCGFLEQIAPWLLAMCYLGVAYFVVENI